MPVSTKGSTYWYFFKFGIHWRRTEPSFCSPFRKIHSQKTKMCCGKKKQHCNRFEVSVKILIYFMFLSGKKDLISETPCPLFRFEPPKLAQAFK